MHSQARSACKLLMQNFSAICPSKFKLMSGNLFSIFRKRDLDQTQQHRIPD